MSAKLSILIVDDEEDLRSAIRDLLELKGWSVTCSANGCDAFEKTKTQHFDVVISDIRMPKCSGVDFLNLLSQEYKNKTPIIMMSAYSDYDETDLIRFGAKMLLPKPLNSKALFEKVRLVTAPLTNAA